MTPCELSDPAYSQYYETMHTQNGVHESSAVANTMHLLCDKLAVRDPSNCAPPRPMGPSAPWDKLKSRYASCGCGFALDFRVYSGCLKLHYVKNCGALTNSKMGMRRRIIFGVCQATGLASVSLRFAYVMRDLVC